MNKPNENNQNCHARSLNTNFEEIFSQSPIGIFFYDKNGKLTNANDSALNIARIPKLDDVLGTNLFDNPKIASKKDEILDKGLINFQDTLDLIEIKKQTIYNPIEPKIIDIDWTVSVIDSGYLIQIQDITARKNIEDHNKKLLENEKQLTEELTASNEELKSTTEELHQHMKYLAELNKYLKQSEEKFFKAFNSNPAPMSLGDGNAWIDVNESFLKLTGYSREELIDHTPAELNFIDVEKRKQYITKSKRQGSIQDTELTIRTKSGENLIVISNIEKIELDGDIRFINFLHDITERKKAEEKIKRVIDTIAESYVEYDNEWRYVNVNSKFEESFGLKRDEIIGKVVWEVLPQTVGTLQYKELHRSKKENIPVRFETKSSVSEDWFEVNAFPYPDGLTVYLHNITERKKSGIELERSNQKISDIIESIQDNFYVIDNDWNYVYINKLSAAAIGMEPKDFIGQNHWKMFSQYRGTVLEDNFREAMGKREVRQFEIYSPYNHNWFIVRVYPSSEGITVLGSNITERKKVEEHNQKLLEKEKQLSEELQLSNEELQSTTEELYKSNTELQRSSKLLSTIYELNPDAIVLTTVSDSKIIDCNQEY